MSDAPDNVRPIRAAVDEAKEVPWVDGSGSKTTGGKRKPPAGDGILPADCPVMPLGMANGIYYYLDAAKQFRAIKDKDHGRLVLMGLFGSKSMLLPQYWERRDKSGKNVVGWRPEECAEALMASAARKGVWSADERVRGPGAWRGPEGELILHCGDQIITKHLDGRREIAEPGAVGRYVYPAGPPGPQPAPEAAIEGAGGPGGRVLDILGTWRWRRGEVDATLQLGWIVASMAGGALSWRPVLWVTGGAGTGKSTLHRLLHDLHDDAIVQPTDATPAGIWQKLRYSTHPVAFDELEAEEDNRKAQAVVKLARQAASGGVVLRGGADHQGAEFVARAAFLFSSILLPPLLGQDRSRLAILELEKLPRGQAMPDMAARALRALGAGLRRRLFDQWPRWEATLESYRHALTTIGGHGARGADQFGTLLAAADLALYDDAPDDARVSAWAEKLRASELIEVDDNEADEQRLVAHLMTATVDPFRSGARKSLGEWIARAASDDPPEDPSQPQPAIEANRVLGTYGLKVIRLEAGTILAIANYHAGLTHIFAGTHWAGRSGAQGVWVQAARRLQGAIPSTRAIWFCGAGGQGYTGRGTLVPIERFLSKHDTSHPIN